MSGTSRLQMRFSSSMLGFAAAAAFCAVEDFTHVHASAGSVPLATDSLACVRYVAASSVSSRVAALSIFFPISFALLAAPLSQAASNTRAMSVRRMAGMIRCAGVRVLAYVYPGWHSIPDRGGAFYPG